MKIRWNFYYGLFLIVNLLIMFYIKINPFINLNLFSINSIKNHFSNYPLIYHDSINNKNVSISCHMNWTLTIINYKKDGFYEKESNLIKMMNCGIHYIRWIRILNPYNVNLSENAVHLFPNERDTLFWYGESIDLINRELSENIFMRLLNRFPEDSDAWYRLARIYESKNEYDKSLECFINACNFGDIRSNGCYNAGRMFEKQGDYLNAIYYYKLSKWRPYHEAADRLEAELSSQNP